MIKKLLPIFSLGFVIFPLTTISSSISIPKIDKKIPKIGSWYAVPNFEISREFNKAIFQVQNGDIYVIWNNSFWVLKKGAKKFTAILDSMVISSIHVKIFQAQNGDLYVMARSSPLRVLKKDADRLTATSGSMITDGSWGTIFQAQNGDLYAMGINSPLRVLKKDADRFTATSGSMITDGSRGTIFQAQNGDLYVMAKNSPLRVLKKDADRFTATSGSMITDGSWGTIFQAQNGDLYVMGKASPRVLKKGAKKFTATSGSMITNNGKGKFFQARNGDLYVIGSRSPLRVLKKGAKKFTATSGSMITTSFKLKIFQAQNGDLYVMGKASPRVLKKGAKKFTATSGSMITNGLWGTIFQAQNGDLYVMGFRSPLRVLKKGAKKFTATSGSMITNGFFGKILQAQNGDLYALATLRKSIEILQNNKLEFFKTDESMENKNDGAINIKNHLNYYSKLQYKSKLESTWYDVPNNGVILNLKPSSYVFQWASKKGEQYKGGTDTTQSNSDKITINTYKIAQANQQAVNDLATKFRNDLQGVASGDPVVETESTLEARTATLPSALITNPSPTTLGFIAPIVAGVDVTYEAASDDVAGTMTVTATITKDIATQKVIFKLSGFQTQVQANQQAVNDLATKFRNDLQGVASGDPVVETESTLEARTATLPSALITNPSPTTLGFIAPIAAGVDVTYEALSDDVAGTMTVTATITKDIATQKVIFKLSGFQTQVQVNQQAVNDLATKFRNDLQGVASGAPVVETESTLEARTTTLPSALITNPSPTTLGFIAPTTTGVDVTYQATSDDAAGTMIVTATISIGDAIPKQVIFRLSKFLKTIKINKNNKNTIILVKTILDGAIFLVVISFLIFKNQKRNKLAKMTSKQKKEMKLKS